MDGQIRVQTGHFNVPVKDFAGDEIGKVTKVTFDVQAQEFHVTMTIRGHVISGRIPVEPFVAPNTVVAPDVRITDRYGTESP